MFWYYIRDNKKTLIFGLIFGLVCIGSIIFYMNYNFDLNSQTVDPQAEVVEDVVEEGGSVYDKYLQNADEVNRANAGNENYNVKPIAKTLKTAIVNLDNFMVSRTKEVATDKPIMISNGITIYELLNDSDYNDFILSLSEHATKGTAKQLLSLYGFGLKDGKIGYQNGVNASAYTVNTQYPFDVVFASDYSADVIVPITKNSSQDIVFDDSNKNATTNTINDPDYTDMTTIKLTFRKQHNRWLVFDVELQNE